MFKLLEVVSLQLYFHFKLYSSYSDLYLKSHRGQHLHPSAKDLYALYKSGKMDNERINTYVNNCTLWSQLALRKYYKALKSAFDKDYAFTHLSALDKKILRSGWNGLNNYFFKYGMLPCASTRIWKFNKIDQTISKFYTSPLISIIVTAFNAEDTIASSIDSLINQTYDNLEIIVINDCSTDRTEAIVNRFIKEDNRIRQVTLAKNSGTYVARNIGLNYCTGDFITVHDADDISHPQKIQFQVNSLINDKSLVGSISYWIRLNDFGQLSLERGLPMLRLNLSSLMIRKSIFDTLGPWIPNRFGSDLEFLERIISEYGKKSVKYIKQPLSIGRHRLGSLTTFSETSVFTEKGRSLRSDFEEIWRRIHLKKYYPLSYKLLKIIGDKAYAVDEFENYHLFRR